MEKAYINSPDDKSAASEYVIEIKYSDGKVLKENVVLYSYSSVFEHIKDMHENENDKKTESIKIECIK